MNAYQQDLHREELADIKVTVEVINCKHKHVIHVPENITGTKLKKLAQAKSHLITNMRHKAFCKNIF